MLLNSSLVRDEAGEPRIVRTTVFDASDRRRYERELLRARADAEERARTALALAHVTEGVVPVGPDGRVVVEAADLRVLGDAEATRRVLADVLENALVYSEAYRARPLLPARSRPAPGIGGTGLGLAIACELVTAMGGRIGLLPRSRGTAVSVDLPLGR